MQYCSSQHQNLLSPPDTFITGCYLLFGSASSFLLELFLYSTPLAYWALTNLRSSSFSIISFCLFSLLLGVLKARMLVVKNTPANEVDVRDGGLIPGLGRSPGGGHGNPLQYSYLENPHGQRNLVGYNKESDMTEAT